MRLVSAATTLTLALLLSACSGTHPQQTLKRPAARSSASGPTAAARWIDPCSLITHDEAVAMLGLSLDPGITTTGSDQCFYRSDATAATYVTLDVQPTASSDVAHQVFVTNEARLRQTPLTVTDVSGVGAHAILARAPGLSSIWVQNGRYVLSMGCGPACSKGALEGEARTILGRLK